VIFRREDFHFRKCGDSRPRLSMQFDFLTSVPVFRGPLLILPNALHHLALALALLLRISFLLLGRPLSLALILTYGPIFGR
jgi:hypothetical protein